MQISENSLNSWILVYNVSPQTQLITINQLTNFGQIQRFYKPSGNLLFVKFQQPISAEIAIMKRTLTITDKHTVGMTPITREIEERFPDLQSIVHTNTYDDTQIAVYPENKQPKLADGFFSKIKDIIFG
ncbi:Conserved_hypothetical protein [Hexamita inflata]|uniref:RRM domain-containing protein n=1 Tax=Hexamita inflata TaxID=28002 RepID=A0AA86R2D3_9EUKA|nr:Conserved hypothetical protein [Hexamita inflata]CAI9914893.1 Conserved hypothetical protein [Hexamita inflata]CAI9925898.1 Conserved hypothetical protein [Hexamita inflata]CAI9970441.1 Conserved hypothetical protein [Hexamita inflata]